MIGSHGDTLRPKISFQSTSHPFDGAFVTVDRAVAARALQLGGIKLDAFLRHLLALPVPPLEDEQRAPAREVQVAAFNLRGELLAAVEDARELHAMRIAIYGPGKIRRGRDAVGRGGRSRRPGGSGC